MTNKKCYDLDAVRRACEEEKTMTAAARRLKVHYRTFKRLAKEAGCYKPTDSIYRQPLNKDVVASLYLTNKQSIHSATLKTYLIRFGFKEAKCEVCGLCEWLGKPIPLELHHKDWNHYNNTLDNLEIVCSNCHRQKQRPGDKIADSHPPAADFYAAAGSQHGDNVAHHIVSASAAGLLELLKNTPNYTKVGRLLGITATAVQKRCARLGIGEKVSALIQAEKVCRGRSAAPQIHTTKSAQRAVESRLANLPDFVAYVIEDLQPREVLRFHTKRELEDAGFNYQVVCKACRGARKTYKGFVWRREKKAKK